MAGSERMEQANSGAQPLVVAIARVVEWWWLSVAGAMGASRRSLLLSVSRAVGLARRGFDQSDGGRTQELSTLSLSGTTRRVNPVKSMSEDSERRSLL